MWRDSAQAGRSQGAGAETSCPRQAVAGTWVCRHCQGARARTEGALRKLRKGSSLRSSGPELSGTAGGHKAGGPEPTDCGVSPGILSQNIKGSYCFFQMLRVR